jgi:hypothetical protein
LFAFASVKGKNHTNYQSDVSDERLTQAESMSDMSDGLTIEVSSDSDSQS